MNPLSETQRITMPERVARPEICKVLTEVCDALAEKGYPPNVQIVGYILSGDPTYITSHRNARSLITKVERDELLDEILWFYLRENA